MKIIKQMKSIKRLVRELKYYTINEAINKEVIIKNIDSVGEDILENLGSILPNCYYVEGEKWRIEGVMAKYGLVDVVFLTSQDVLDSYPVGKLPLLKDLGFIDVDNNFNGDDLGFEEFQEDPFCFNDLVEGIDKKQIIVKIFLEDKLKKDRNKFPTPLTVSQDFFPHSFQVTDACITNSSFVWFHKHFYL